MKEQLISFETAKLAKEKGFDLLVQGYYYKHSKSKKETLVTKEPSSLDYHLPWCNYSAWRGKARYSAPTQSLLQKWLREKHNCVVFTKPWIGANFGVCTDTFYSIIYLKNYRQGETELEDTYEEALKKGLQEALKLIP